MNLLYLLPGVVGGTETYARLLIEQLRLLDPSNEYLLFVNEESRGLPLPTSTNFRRIVCPVRASSRAVRYFWEQAILPRYLRVEGVDVLHSLGYVGPRNPGCAHVVTIHDVNYQSSAIRIPRAKRAILGWFVESVAARADHILTVSEFSKRQIVDLLHVPAGKITVTHLAADPGRSLLPRSRLSTASPHDATGSPYILAFGGTAPHKNIVRLVAAFATIARKVPHRLLIVGTTPADGSVMSQVEASGVADRVTMTGYLSDAEVNSVLRGACVLVFPSLYEGFGLPVLDAQAVGVAVACSTAGSLPEIAGSGALPFAPESVSAIAEAVLTLITDPALRGRLVLSGYENVRRFSWAATAATTLSVYETLVAAHADRQGKLTGPSKHV